jgi:sterol 14alpha-demethylase
MDLANVLSTWASQILLTTTIAGVVLAAAILLNSLAQLLFKDLNEPPVVFHWVPFLGSTISYGIDPYKFFFSCQEKVSRPL